MNTPQGGPYNTPVGKWALERVNQHSRGEEGHSAGWILQHSGGKNNTPVGKWTLGRVNQHSKGEDGHSAGWIIQHSGGKNNTPVGKWALGRVNQHSGGEDEHSGGRINTPGGGGRINTPEGINTTQRVWTLRRVIQYFRGSSDTPEEGSTLKKDDQHFGERIDQHKSF